MSTRCIFMVYSRDTEASWRHVALKSQNKCTNQLASPIVFGWLSPIFVQVALSKNYSKTYDLCSLAFRSVFYTVLICISSTNGNLLYHSLILFCLHLDRKKKKADNNFIRRSKYRSINSPRCPALWFVYILMPGTEEWVLV